jgi:hypothetical protein
LYEGNAERILPLLVLGGYVILDRRAPGCGLKRAGH